LSLHDIVPAHRDTKVKDKYSSFNRCLLCLNCSVEGAECPRNLVNKDSVWTCSCERQGLDCDYCRLCHRCISYLKKLEATVCPIFKQGQTVRDNIRTEGSLVGASGRDTLTLEEPMTPDLFNRLDLIFIRGCIIHIEVKFEEMGELVWYTSETGEVKVVDKDGKILHQENPQTKAIEGDMISIILCHKGNDFHKAELILRVNNGTIYARSTPSSTCTLSLTNINPMMYQIIRHGFQLDMKKKEDGVTEDEIKREETVKGPDGDTFKKCVKTSSYAMEAWMVMYKPLLEELLFTIGGVDYSGAVTLNLPRKIDLQVCQFPSFNYLKQELMDHSLCYTRTKVSEMQTVPATAAIPDTWHIYRMIHFVDAEGNPHSNVKLPDGSTPALCLMWAWHLLMATKDRIVLPRVYSNLLPDIPQTEEAISKAVIGLQDLIRLQMWKMHVELKDNKDFQKNTTFESSMFEEETVHLRSALKARLDSSALHEVQSKFFENTILYLCEGHSACMKVEEGLTEVLPEIYGPYSHYLTSIDFPANNIVELKPEIFHVLPNLTSLDASNNYLENFPSTIGLCRNLHNLSLADNNLSDLPDELADCQKLTRIEISNNVMDVIPSVITKLRNLERLFCSHMMLTSLPENIGILEKLEKLYINGNCLTSLPKSFAKLKNLQDLGLSGVPWVSMSSKKMLSFENFSHFLDSRRIKRWLEAHNEDQMMLFQYFDADSNGTLDNEEVGKLNAAIFNLFPRFGYMGVEPPDNDTPGGFPEEILSCTNLEYLNMYYQGLVSVPADIQKLTKLKVLNIGHNPYLLSIPAELGRIQTLQRLELDECPLLKTPPKEIRDKGFASTYAYLQRLLSGSTSCKRTKLMLVGLGGAGKTSLVRSLLSKDGKAQLTLGEEITDGIDISTWTVNKDGDQLTFNVWDFAGQTIYYNTHQFFLSNRAVYLLLWNVRLGYEHAGLDFWLNSISVHAPQAPIFVVGSHSDQVASLELPIEELKERYRQIAGFHFISSWTGMGIKELQQQLVEVALQQQYMGEQIPEVWLKFENFIISRRSTENLIEFKEIEKLAGLSGIFDKGEIFRAVQFLHDLGTIQYFTNEYLKSRVVINPQWIVDIMACVVSVKDSPIKEGRLKHQDINKIWKDYPEELNSWLLRMTEEYDLTFPMESEKVNLVPCLLPEKQPKIDWPELDKNSEEKENKMIYKFDYLPAGLFNRGQVRLHQFSDSSLIWKRGSYLKKNGHIALIQQYRDSELIVTVRGPRPENILFMVHEVFDGLISESFRGVTYDFLMPCLDCVKHNVKEPHMFAASTIRRALELKAPFLQCTKYFHNVSCVDLLTCMPPDSHSEFDLHIAHAVRGLKALRKDLTADIFLSYCDKDAGKDRNSKIHPVMLSNDLKARGYKCYFPPSGLNKSMDDMARALFDASVFVSFMSANYSQDEACCSIFKYARLVLKKPMVVVAIGDGYDWKQSQLGILLTDEVYINMTNDKLPHYQSKFDELLAAIHEKTNQMSDLTQTAPCFLSYTWVNSKTAVDLGTRYIPNAIGWGDPRELKMYLEKNGIRCWIDVERVGQKGLFEDIAGGLLNARVAVVCISDEYADSSICCNEFRYASKVLELPIILAVTGTGSKWRASEIGVLSLNYPIVNFQEKSDTAHERLLQLVREQLSSHMEEEASLKEKKNKINEEQKNLSFQELYELAQRKLMRQISLYAESQDIEPYPQLFVIDFLEENEMLDESEETEESSKKSDPPKLQRMPSHVLISRKSSQNRSWVRVKTFCVHILCEDEEGWHSCSEPILLPDNFGTNYLEKFSPYLSRMSTVVMYNKQLVLNCMKQEQGEEFFKWLEETPQAANSNYQEIYCEFRQMVIDADTDKKMGGLARCHLPNGKTIWLCEKHRNRGRITVLSNEVVKAHHKLDDGGTTNYMIVGLKAVESQKFVQIFQSSEKAHKKVPVIVEDVKSPQGKKESKPMNKLDSQKKMIQSPSLKMSSSGLQKGSQGNKEQDEYYMDKTSPVKKVNVNIDSVGNKTLLEAKTPTLTKSKARDSEIVQKENSEETKKETVTTGTSSASASKPLATSSKTEDGMKEEITPSSKSSTPTDASKKSGAAISEKITPASRKTPVKQQFSSTTVEQSTLSQLQLRKSERQKSKACVVS
ncbi:hypothetical protein ACJMK2_044420, partial [Sinanodonta woodiana]